jgi:HlyD family type I secretion membrane fusion protein
MKLDLGPARPGYVTPTFSQEIGPLDPRLDRRMKRPMIIGGAIIGALVVGLGLWASLTPLASGVAAPGEVEVESNLKTLRHREGGTVRQINVQEGQKVRTGQPLILLDDTTAKASVDVLQNQADLLMAQAARAQAEATDKSSVDIPPELAARMSDVRVAGLVRDQQFLFANRLQLYQSQTQVLEQRIDQSQNQIAGNQAQVDSVQDQLKLTDEEMDGYKTLYAKGYAPKSLILRYERSMADLSGRKGQLLADIARLRQQMGETRIQMVSLKNQRETQAADELRDAQGKLADVMPRLAAARETLDGTVLRAPVNGYVFNLTQYTTGAAVGSGEVLMQLVPTDAPMRVSAMVKPQDIATVHMGMKAQVRIIALNPRWHKPMEAKVVMVSPAKSAPPASARAAAGGGGGSDQRAPDPTAMGFYRIDVQIDPKELTKLRPDERITPGMPASVMLVSGKRTLMGFLISPITDTIDHAFHEQ